MRTTLLHENLGLKTLDDLADGYIRMLTVSPPPSNFDEPEQRLMTAVLSILIEHEVAHLDLTSPAFALRAKLETDFASNRIDQPEYRAQRRQISLNEERRADGIALDRAEKLIGAQIPNGLGSKAKAVLARVPLISISALFRDRVMFFGMEKFRNLRSEDITFEFSHYACGDKPAEGNFNEPKAIQNARERPMPVMSQAEFESARSRLLTERIGEETHDHYLVRAKLIDDRVRAGDQNDSYYFLDTSEQLSLVTALVRNDPTLAQNKSNKSLFRPLGGVSMNDILSSVRKTAKVVEAVTCPTVKCYVGYMKDDLGYLELIGDDNQLSEFRWMFKVRGYSQEQYLRLMVEMGEIFLTIGGEEPLKALVQMRNPVLCGRGAAFMETKTRVYHTTTVNRGGWIYVRIFSPKVFAAIGMPSKEELQNQKVNPSFDCELAKRPEEQAICSDPELSRLDASLSQLYKKFSGIRMVVEEQRAWLAARNKCGSDGRCLEKLYRERISTLTSQINKTLSDLQTKPSFYCALATQSDEKAICSDPFLSKLDIALSERYSGLLRDRSGAARDRLVDEQRRWLLRRRQCKDDTTCLRQLYQQRIDGLATVN